MACVTSSGTLGLPSSVCLCACVCVCACTLVRVCGLALSKLSKDKCLNNPRLEFSAWVSLHAGLAVGGLSGAHRPWLFSPPFLPTSPFWSSFWL